MSWQVYSQLSELGPCFLSPWEVVCIKQLPEKANKYKGRVIPTAEKYCSLVTSEHVIYTHLLI